MRRAWLICLPLVLVLAAWSVVSAQAEFYVIPVKEKNNIGGLPARVPKTGQTTSYGPRDDGALQMGAIWPKPRFTDNNNGSVTDNLTGLIWMKNANAFGFKGWYQALDIANNLKSGDAGITDGSRAGDWRLPNVRELQSLVDYGRYNLALPAGHPFTNTDRGYWTSTTKPTNFADALGVDFFYGEVYSCSKYFIGHVWCVRGGP